MRFQIRLIYLLVRSLSFALGRRVNLALIDDNTFFLEMAQKLFLYFVCHN